MKRVGLLLISLMSIVILTSCGGHNMDYKDYKLNYEQITVMTDEQLISTIDRLTNYTESRNYDFAIEKATDILMCQNELNKRAIISAKGGNKK